ncbi:class I SAM-dependent methyltransferase [Propionivibrio soli]|uniref:class I SAM-dependent methyltransferase n=1 Tax=Propionivibrio soli TaxID=2976531 RepID=UPI0021E82AB6|nr:class I SAM-dependent methyltransferase [Propionivibrio soli]
MNMWDQNYSIEGYKYGTSPNHFLVQQEHLLPRAARVLVPGDGEGRNGVWLASQGHRVTSVDSSAVGLAKARALAERQSVQLQTVLADLADWSPAAQSCDAVALIFVHLPSATRQDVHRRLAQSLARGGILILEAFHPAQLGYGSGGPKDADMLYTLESLRADFSGVLEELSAFEGEIALDEGAGHQGQGYVTRWVGRAASHE